MRLWVFAQPVFAQVFHGRFRVQCAVGSDVVVEALVPGESERGDRAVLSCRNPTAEGLRMRPDKQKVIDEVWDDARIRGFLDKAPLGAGVDPDFSALIHAYRSMRPSDFEVFIGYFKQAGRNLDARGENGETLAEVIGEHRCAAPFRHILESAARNQT